MARTERESKTRLQSHTVRIPRPQVSRMSNTFAQPKGIGSNMQNAMSLEMRHPPTKSSKCGRCRIVKPRDAFNINPAYRSGLQSYCNECQRIYERERRNRPEVKLREREQLREWRRKNKTK